ncbi:polysaccharide deacetylase family protein [Streptomyces coeruleorubidus]|uniref:polysaccharide deacetylase family protein n=1 Tax=Streptomyces coeruleorubidus TaxID=116188 RepID=UPI00237F922F|nr:polysaccharide deacetylase family protein [Streptomyces coeruleorubidus]WDV51822.1 polysaccharide deacetylase family protein [Streptomyces coeruleorubidus]
MLVSADRAPSAAPGPDRPRRRPGPPAWVAMYHSVGDCSDDPYRVTVSPGRLDRQLGWLRRRGLRGVGVHELLAARARGQGQDLVGLTFDDGYADFLTHALPLLRRHACGATLFVLPGRLGGENAWDPDGPRKPLLSADGIRHAAAEGVEIGSHGLTHVDLTRADDAQLRAEVRDSRAALGEMTGAHIHGFCYPYGRLDRRAVDAVRDAGYSYACATGPGDLSGLLAIPRVHIGERDTAWRLRLKHLLRRHPVEGV